MRRVPVIGLALLALVFALDQLLKYMVRGPLGLSEEGDARTLLPVFDLRFVHNPGVSLGLFRAGSGGARWALVALTAVIAVGVLVWMWRERNRFDQAALGVIAGGALGNILDRARLGYVVDYADLHVGPVHFLLHVGSVHLLAIQSDDWRPFLVFNLGDAAITLGVVLLLLRALLTREKKPRGQVEEANA